MATQFYISLIIMYLYNDFYNDYVFAFV